MARQRAAGGCVKGARAAAKQPQASTGKKSKVPPAGKDKTQKDCSSCDLHADRQLSY